MSSPDIQIVSKHPISGHGTTQIRCIQPAKALRSAGYSVSVQTIYSTIPTARRLIILHRVIMDEYTRHFITCAQARGVPLIYDTDDLLFDPDGIDYLSRGTKAQNYTNGWKPYANVMSICDAVTVSTDFLAARAQNVNPNTHVILNALSEDYLQIADKVVEQRNKEMRKVVTIAYLSGSRSHDADFATIEDVLVNVLHKYPSARLLLVGPLEVSDKFDKFDNKIIRLDFKPYSDFPTIFSEVDINLIPLEIDQAFCHAKSELKFIEAAACGVVSVASPTNPHKAAIKHGHTGLLATNDWEECIEALIKDKALRKRLGDNAQQHIKMHYVPEKCKQTWQEIIPAVLETHTVKSVAWSEYIFSHIRLTLKYWRRTLQLEFVKKLRNITPKGIEKRYQKRS